MIEARHLTKRYGKAVAVDGVSFVVQPGRVTGFPGPNGAGKSTAMRMILGLDTPSSGSVLVNGQPYGGLSDPLRAVGALLDAKAVVGGRSAANHLRWLAPADAWTPNPPPGSSPARHSARSSRTTAHPPPQPDPQPRRTPPMAHIHTAARPAARPAAWRPLQAPLALALALAAPATSLLPALTTGLRGTGTTISFPPGFVTALTGGTP